MAQGEIALQQRGEGYSTRGEGYALPLALGPLAGMFGDSLVLVVRIDNNVISGRASVGKPGPSVPKGDSALFRAIEKSPEALGWVGLSKLSVGTPKNALEGGSLKLGADAARFTLGGFVDGTANVSVEGDRVTFSGSAEVKLPGASAGTFQVNYAPDKGLFGEAHLEVGLGKVSGGVDARLQQGVLDIQGTVGYAGDRLKGSITLMATDAATAREITRKPPQGGGLPGQESGGAAAGAGAGAGAGAAPAAAKPGPRAFCGWGELDFTLTDWLTEARGREARARLRVGLPPLREGPKPVASRPGGQNPRPRAHPAGARSRTARTPRRPRTPRVRRRTGRVRRRTGRARRSDRWARSSRSPPRASRTGCGSRSRARARTS